MRPERPHSGVLEPGFLLNAYRHGFFPMANTENGELSWYSPDPRAIIAMDVLEVPRSLRRTIERRTFDIRIDTQFEPVMRHCAQRTETWISEDIVRGYIRLYERGFAHSVEAWREERLAGGLYGVSIGGAFFGESMFSLQRDASKVALVWLIQHLKGRGFHLLDTQFVTSHLERFGAREIPREAYLTLLRGAVELPCSFR